MGKITGYNALAATATNDLLVIVDVDDLSMAPTGTDKKITVANLVGGSLPQFYAANSGVVADGVTDNGAALNTALQTMWSLGGGVLVLPPAPNALGKQIMTGRTIIIPPNCVIDGQGFQTTTLRLLNGANCDVVQFMQYNSSAQAAILGVAAGTLKNAFYSGLRNLTVHGNQGGQSASSYNNCLTAVTNPLTTGAPTDPDFDPTNFADNVEFRSATGDGLFANGRSQLRVTRCLFRYNLGNGATLSFDTITTTSNFGENGMAGVYVNHGSCDGAGNKSFNNGSNPQWVSGSNYSALARVMYNGALYGAINALTNDTVAPASDPTNWAPITATSPAAWGTGFYFDANASECSWTACDGQENAATDYYLKSCVNINVQGVSWNVDWNATGGGPPYQASVALDGATGCIVSVSSSTRNANAYVLRVVNAATRNQVTMAGDTSGAGTVSPDSVALIGSGNSVTWNGASLTASTPTNAGVFGDGSNGAATLDGVATVTWATLAGSTYTMNKDTFLTSLTINSGVTLVPAGFRVFCLGTVTNNGTIAANGTAATSSTGATGTGSGSTAGSGPGGGGQTGAGTAGTGGGVAMANAGAGGTGSSGAAGGGGASTSQQTGYFRPPEPILCGAMSVFGSVFAPKGGGGGGGGGGDGTNKGGGGGSGGGIIAILAQAVVNSATGSMTATGGNGFTPVTTTGGCGGGGGGAGGVILLYTLSAWTNSGSTNVTGGTAGSGVGTGTAGANGGNGTVLNVVVQ